MNEIDDKRALKNAMNQEKDDLNKKNITLESEISNLKTQINNTNPKTQDLQIVEDLRELVKRLRKEILDLEQDKIKLARNYDELLNESKKLAQGWMIKFEKIQEENLCSASINNHLSNDNKRMSNENMQYATRLVLAYAELERQFQFKDTLIKN